MSKALPVLFIGHALLPMLRNQNHSFHFALEATFFRKTQNICKHVELLTNLLLAPSSVIVQNNWQMSAHPIPFPPADPGVRPPRFFQNHAVFRQVLGSGPPWGQNSASPPDQDPGSTPDPPTTRNSKYFTELRLINTGNEMRCNIWFVMLFLVWKFYIWIQCGFWQFIEGKTGTFFR